MASQQDNPNKIAFTSRCLPGSVAEQEEKERLIEFHRQKALRKAEEAQKEAEQKVLREEQFQSDCAANQNRRQKTTYAYSQRNH